MISAKDQEELFRLIADYLPRDIDCLAIGGTAMMFLGYTGLTKDLDIVFRSEEDRKAFVQAIEALGYRKGSLLIYDEKRRAQKNLPVVYSRGEERFDLFVKQVFGFPLEFEGSHVQRQDFIGKKELRLFVLSEEMLVLLKSVTNREKDFEDIERIAKAKAELDWDWLVLTASRHRDRVPWLLVDLEEKLRRLQKMVFIKERVFKAIYATEGRAEKRK
ncbi:MAG: DUF6036 family nucleotidyltransferase [Nanoarchaeota archaeon]